MIAYMLLMPSACKPTFAFDSTSRCSLIWLANNSPPNPIALAMTSCVGSAGALRVLAFHRPPRNYLSGNCDLFLYIVFHFQCVSITMVSIAKSETAHAPAPSPSSDLENEDEVDSDKRPTIQE